MIQYDSMLAVAKACLAVTVSLARQIAPAFQIEAILLEAPLKPLDLVPLVPPSVQNMP